jgi:hypothetical protein
MPTPLEEFQLPSANYLDVDWDSRGEQPPWDTVITLAEISTLAYTTAHNRTLVLRLLGFDTIETLDVGPGSGLVAYAGDVGVVAFRGTDDLEDWLANADFFDRPPFDGVGEVHRGFQDRYGALAGLVLRSIESQKPRKLWITGHSLGGAMAACCAIDLLRRQIAFTGLVTFGQPRIGNGELARYLDERTQGKYLRFVNEGDLVPLAPPGLGLKLPDYWHCGDRLRFDGDRLHRWHGLAVFSCKAPGSEGEPATSDASAPDGEGSLTEEQLREVQEQLRRRRMTGKTEGHATEVVGASPKFAKAHSVGSAMGDFIGGLAANVQKRIDDHSMTEYLRAMNAFRNRGG